MRWIDTYGLCSAHHLRVADILPCVDLIAWDNQRPGNGYRSRRRGDYLLVLQKPPLVAKTTWCDHGIPSRWVEKIDLKTYPRKLYPHTKPIGLIARLIGAVTKPGDLVVDPAAGSPNSSGATSVSSSVRIARERGRYRIVTTPGAPW